MIYKHLLLLTFLLSSISLVAQTYITNVTVVDVQEHKLIPNQTVVIVDDLISDIQSSDKIKIPENATIIEGTGKYLLPGMTDAHIHFFQNGGLYTRPDAIDLRKLRPYDQEIDYSLQNKEKVLLRYLQNGITNVIDVGSTVHFLQERKRFAERNDVPSIYMTGPLLTTYEPMVYQDLGDDEPFSLVKSVEEGIQMVKEQLPHQPDFIKIWYIVGADGLSVEASARNNLPIVKAVIEEAHKNGLKVAVHATQRITAQLAVESGCDLLVHSVEDEVLQADFVKLMKQNKTMLCPTMIVHSGYINTFGQKLALSNHELRMADPFQLGTLLDLKHLQDTLLVDLYKTQANSTASVQRLQKADSIRMTNLKILADAGVLIATGTDAGNIGTLHASSYLAELQAMHASGMSNWQILEASTINGAKVLDRENEFGSVKVGKKANLVLLNANPVEDIDHVTEIITVINNGIFYKPNEILKDTPSDLAQRQLNAYNLRNIEAFLEPYDEEVEIYLYPDKFQYKGKETMRKSYAQMFDNTPNLHCELKGRIAQGNIVIDQERVQFGSRILEAVAIYHVENGKIKKVYFIQ